MLDHFPNPLVLPKHLARLYPYTTACAKSVCKAKDRYLRDEVLREYQSFAKNLITIIWNVALHHNKYAVKKELNLPALPLGLAASFASQESL